MYDSEFVELKVRIEKIFDGSSMRYEVINISPTLSEKFKKVMIKDWDIDVDEYTAFNAIRDSVVEVDFEEDIFIFDE